MSITTNLTVIDGAEYLLCRDTEQRPLFRFALGLLGPDRSITAGWEYLPLVSDQLRYLREHYTTKGGQTAYKPVLLIQMLEDIYSDGAAYGTIQHFQVLWSDLDEEAFDNGHWLSQALKGCPPGRRHLEKRVMHDMTGIPVGKCLNDCDRVLDSKRDSDHSICQPCWDSM